MLYTRFLQLYVLYTVSIIEYRVYISTPKYLMVYNINLLLPLSLSLCLPGLAATATGAAVWQGRAGGGLQAGLPEREYTSSSSCLVVVVVVPVAAVVVLLVSVAVVVVYQNVSTLVAVVV